MFTFCIENHGVQGFNDQEKPHIVSLNETKLDQSICDSSVEVTNDDIIRNDRNRFGGLSRAQHGLSPSGNLINMHKIGKIVSVWV